MMMIMDGDLERIKNARDATKNLEHSSTNPTHSAWAQKTVWLLNTVLGNIESLQKEKPNPAPVIVVTDAPSDTEVLRGRFLHV